jgi:solute carrier family 25 oxoglutarate transporter 11
MVDLFWLLLFLRIVTALYSYDMIIGVYSQAKEMLVKTGYFSEGMPLHFAASLVSGFVSTAVSIPIDISKTRLQNMKVIDGKPQYSGTLDCLQKVIR